MVNLTNFSTRQFNPKQHLEIIIIITIIIIFNNKKQQSKQLFQDKSDWAIHGAYWQ
jgi:hypothetical protein